RAGTAVEGSSAGLAAVDPTRDSASGLAAADPTGGAASRRTGTAVGGPAPGLAAVDPTGGCPQLEPALDAALAEACAAGPPDGELALLIGHAGGIAVATERAWPGAARLIGRAGIAGVVAAGAVHGDAVREIEPGLWSGPWDFAQASAAGNAALIATA